MPWRYMLLRGQRVLARCDSEGRAVAEDGRVEIRYRRDDGKAYRAAAANLTRDADDTVFPDVHCSLATTAPAGSAKKPGKSRSGKSAKSSSRTHATPPSMPEGDEVLAYCDGACSGNPGPAGLGVVMRWDDRSRVLSEYLGQGTNNIAELTAILRVLEAMPSKSRPLRVYTDSSYAIGLLMKGHKAKKNVELVAALREAMGKLADVEIHYVKGHAGVPLNELADTLAVQAIERRDTSDWRDERVETPVREN